MSRLLISLTLSLAAISVSVPVAQAQSEKLSPIDQQFLQDAGQAGATELAASKLALTHASDRQVREFAQRMIVDHTKLARNLDVLAKRHGITDRTAQFKMASDVIASITSSVASK